MLLGLRIKIFRDVKYSIGDIVNYIVMTKYGTRWVLELSGIPS